MRQILHSSVTVYTLVVSRQWLDAASGVHCLLAIVLLLFMSQMAVQRQKCVVRFGFVHLLVTNIAMWVCTAVSEIQIDYTVGRHQLATPTTPSTTGFDVAHTPIRY